VKHALEHVCATLWHRAYASSSWQHRCKANASQRPCGIMQLELKELLRNSPLSSIDTTLELVNSFAANLWSRVVLYKNPESPT